MLKILIVEDDEVLNKGLQYCLNDDGYITTGIYSVSEARDIVEKEEFDLIILDVNLPDGDGFSLCSSIKKEKKEIPIIFLTAKDLEKDAIRGFDLGADDYVTKPFNINILKKKIVAILKRYQKIWGRYYEIKSLKVDFEKRVVYKDGNIVNVTPTEYRILEAFIEKKNKVITKDYLIEYLYNQDSAYIEEHALSVYISRLRGKIEDEANQFIKTIYGMGYMWIDE